ncbi:hypothetical protein [Parvularcula sp. LCG005]|uniref:hypothetical protein n=1 Tax=Parvularcula sp. LCG005 TaxID=3078805 RepID=UPI002941D164|nr:hypothetical protein [Parvularcula sp. LCG005]WOI54291.1 hypothetical protein RUI03_04645 [Parvularcula sp. LCG005]
MTPDDSKQMIAFAGAMKALHKAQPRALRPLIGSLRQLRQDLLDGADRTVLANRLERALFGVGERFGQRDSLPPVAELPAQEPEADGLIYIHGDTGHSPSAGAAPLVSNRMRLAGPPLLAGVPGLPVYNEPNLQALYQRDHGLYDRDAQTLSPDHPEGAQFIIAQGPFYDVPDAHGKMIVRWPTEQGRIFLAHDARVDIEVERPGYLQFSVGPGFRPGFQVMWEGGGNAEPLELRRVFFGYARHEPDHVRGHDWTYEMVDAKKPADWDRGMASQSVMVARVRSVDQIDQGADYSWSIGSGGEDPAFPEQVGKLAPSCGALYERAHRADAGCWLNMSIWLGASAFDDAPGGHIQFTEAWRKAGWMGRHAAAPAHNSLMYQWGLASAKGIASGEAHLAYGRLLIAEKIRKGVPLTIRERHEFGNECWGNHFPDQKAFLCGMAVPLHEMGLIDRAHWASAQGWLSASMIDHIRLAGQDQGVNLDATCVLASNQEQGYDQKWATEFGSQIDQAGSAAEADAILSGIQANQWSDVYLIIRGAQRYIDDGHAKSGLSLPDHFAVSCAAYRNGWGDGILPMLAYHGMKFDSVTDPALIARVKALYADTSAGHPNPGDRLVAMIMQWATDYRTWRDRGSNSGVFRGSSIVRNVGREFGIPWAGPYEENNHAQNEKNKGDKDYSAIFAEVNARLSYGDAAVEIVRDRLARVRTIHGDEAAIATFTGWRPNANQPWAQNETIAPDDEALEQLFLENMGARAR